MRPQRYRRTTTRRVGIGRRGIVYLLVVVAFLAFVIGYEAFPGSPPSKAGCSGPGCVSDVAAAAATPAAMTVFTGALASSACPYCDQDPNIWVRSTTVPPPDISGHSATVLEGSCGRLVYGLRENEQAPPASIAKIVSALVVAQQEALDEPVDVEINGWDLAAEDGSSIAGLVAGTRVSVEDLLYALMLPSGNDAALALADDLGGSGRFVDLMNQLVQRDGLKNTHFANPDGRDAPGNYTSALDIVLLGRELMASPALRTIAGAQQRVAPWDGHTMWNTNYFVYGYPGAIGVKFGYTEGAHETVVAAAVRDGRELYASVLASDFAYLDAVKLLNWAYKNTTSVCPAAAAQAGG